VGRPRTRANMGPIKYNDTQGYPKTYQNGRAARIDFERIAQLVFRTPPVQGNLCAQMADLSGSLVKARRVVRRWKRLAYARF
jgi:hypothetical protein